MGVSVCEPLVSASRPLSSRPAFFALLVAGAAIWLPLLNHLRHEWTLNEQYHYGFSVPLIAAYLAYLRWPDRPEPRPFNSPAILGVAGGGLLFALLPLMLVEAANPDWRLLSWLWAGLAVALTGLGLCSGGGGPWVRHFFAPVTFILLAVPWPMGFEVRVVQELMRSNAAAAVEIFHWLAIPAEQAGNIIRAGSVSVSVDEACSGVRSLQTSLMAGWLLGELHRLNAVWRIGVAAGCVIIALLWNVLRTLLLVWIALEQGTDAMTAWHDQVGFVALGVAIISWIAVAQLASRLTQVGRQEQWIVPGVASPTASIQQRVVGRGVSLPGVLCWAVLGWSVACWVAVEAWYWPSRTTSQQPFAWTVRWPADLGTREVPIPGRARAILKYTHGTNRIWNDAAGRRWTAFHLEWEPGRTASALARAHRPEICLPATGRELLEDRGTHTFGSPLAFRHYVFSDADGLLNVFFSQESLDTAGEPIFRELTREERFRAVRERLRNAGQQQLEFGIWGLANAEEAERVFTAALQRLIVPHLNASAK